jgi:hypothetical protein
MDPSDSGLYGMFDVVSRGEEILALVIAAWHRMQPLLSACQNHSQPSID